MDQEQREDTRQYKAVVNHEEQYSIWFAERPSPAGWRDAGKAGTKQECLDFIAQIWVDMRPLSLRTRTKEAAEAASAQAK
jgi:MbtH protein